MLKESFDTAVQVNGIYVLARDLQSALGTFSFNLFVWTHDEKYKVRLLGSATPLLYRNNHFVICTGHQIKDVAPEDVSMLTDDGELAVTSSGYSMLQVGPEGMLHDLQDIAVFDFNDACEAHPSLRRRFFRLTQIPPDCPSDAIIAVLNYGYPSEDQIYELYDSNHIGSRRRGTMLKAFRQPNDETLLHLKPVEELAFNPDGLSGGPNFVIQQAGEVFNAYFAGVTVRAGKNDLFLVKSGFIKELLDSAMDFRD